MMEKKPVFDYHKLRGRIVEKYSTQDKFRFAMGMTHSTLSKKLCGVTYFTQAEIYRASKLLDIEPERVSVYFFTPIV